MAQTPSKKPAPAHSAAYVAGMEHLVTVVQDLSHARDLDAVMAIVRTAARRLTGADGAAFVLRDGDKCFYAEEDAVAPLWKGKRFPLETCISGWAMLNAQSAVIEDIYADPRIPADAYRPTFVKSLAMVPIRKSNPVGAIGNYWATRHQPTEDEVVLLEALANVTSVALENVDLYARLQNKLRALEESNADLTHFAWAASHDLKAPLHAVDSLSRWILEDSADKLGVESRAHMNALRGRVKRMRTLLDDLLSYALLDSKMDGKAAEPADGASIVKEVVALLDVPDGFDIRVAPEMSSASVPRLPVQNVLHNLVGNALKHHGGDKGVIEVGVRDAGAHYVFTVSDDGPGIPAEYHERIFQMFQTLQSRDKTEGSGMGLAIVRKIVARHGGTVTVESGNGRGAAFHVTWPKG